MLLSDVYKEDPARAEELYQAGIKQYGYNDFGGLTKIISYLLADKKYSDTIPFYFNLIKSEPNRYDYRLDLAKIYYLTGNLSAALEQVNIIKDKAPNILEGYEEFINSLSAGGN